MAHGPAFVAALDAQFAGGGASPEELGVGRHDRPDDLVM
jgi:hypothetical protein